MMRPHARMDTGKPKPAPPPSQPTPKPTEVEAHSEAAGRSTSKKATRRPAAAAAAPNLVGGGGRWGGKVGWGVWGRVGAANLPVCGEGCGTGGGEGSVGAPAGGLCYSAVGCEGLTTLRQEGAGPLQTRGRRGKAAEIRGEGGLCSPVGARVVARRDRDHLRDAARECGLHLPVKPLGARVCRVFVRGMELQHGVCFSGRAAHGPAGWGSGWALRDRWALGLTKAGSALCVSGQPESGRGGRFPAHPQS
jgi:hypothetical protein